MNTPNLPTLVFVLFALLFGSSCTYELDPDEIPCGNHECSVHLHTEAPRCWMHGDNQRISYMTPLKGGDHTIPNACRRSNIFDGDGYLVAYPSAGGFVFLREPSAVDLQHLGLPNTHDTARSAGRDDDDLAARMVQLGAQWWPYWDLYLRHSHRIGFIFYNHHFPSRLEVAYPATGGVWVANFTQDSLRWRYDEPPHPLWLPHPPNKLSARLQYALTMDDKAEMMKTYGATFYPSADEVPGLAGTVDEAVDLFEPFRQRLKDMDDDGYRQRFEYGDDEAGDADAGHEQPSRSGWGIMSLFWEL